MTDHQHCPQWSEGGDVCCLCGHRKEDDGLRARVVRALEECRTLIPEAQADAVMPVVEAELERLRAEQATPAELAARQRWAWHEAGLCPMCGHEDGRGWLCRECVRTFRAIPSAQRGPWRRFLPRSGTPIQGHGYTPAGLLGVDIDDAPPAGGAARTEEAPSLRAALDESMCDAEPPPVVVDAEGRSWTAGDCWCTLPPGHDGEHQCGPCTERHGAPGWTDEEDERG